MKLCPSLREKNGKTYFQNIQLCRVIRGKIDSHNKSGFITTNEIFHTIWCCIYYFPDNTMKSQVTASEVEIGTAVSDRNGGCGRKYTPVIYRIKSD